MAEERFAPSSEHIAEEEYERCCVLLEMLEVFKDCSSGVIKADKTISPNPYQHEGHQATDPTPSGPASSPASANILNNSSMAPIATSETLSACVVSCIPPPLLVPVYKELCRLGNQFESSSSCKPNQELWAAIMDDLSGRKGRPRKA